MGDVELWDEGYQECLHLNDAAVSEASSQYLP